MERLTRAAGIGERIRGDYVHGSLYSDADVFAEELEKIWSGTRARCRTHTTS